MTSSPSFAELMLPMLGAGLFLIWVISDVLEEQLLGRRRRERQSDVRRRERAQVRTSRRTGPTQPAGLPRAYVRRDMQRL